MKKLMVAVIGIVALMSSLCFASEKPAPPAAPVAGTEVVAIGVTVTELTDVVKGWSVKKKVLGQPVYNDKDEKIGAIDDLIVAADRTVGYAIVGAGGFLGIDRHDIAVPVKQFQIKDGKFILPGAEKDTVKKMPPFKYAD